MAFKVLHGYKCSHFLAFEGDFTDTKSLERRLNHKEEFATVLFFIFDQHHKVLNIWHNN